MRMRSSAAADVCICMRRWVAEQRERSHSEARGGRRSHIHGCLAVHSFELHEDRCNGSSR